MSAQPFAVYVFQDGVLSVGDVAENGHAAGDIMAAYIKARHWDTFQNYQGMGMVGVTYKGALLCTCGPIATRSDMDAVAERLFHLPRLPPHSPPHSPRI
jgi:hypothetical protein